MPTGKRGEVWLVDLGLAAKVRPCLVLSIPPGAQDRVLTTVVPHTTSVRGTPFEVVIAKSFLQTGAFDAQGVVTIASARLLRRLGALSPAEMALVEAALRKWLGL